LGINNDGHYAVLGLVIVVFINAVKKMVSRVLVLLVSMGITFFPCLVSSLCSFRLQFLIILILGVGTVKWTIGETRNKLALLSMFYLFFAFLLQVPLIASALPFSMLTVEFN